MGLSFSLPHGVIGLQNRSTIVPENVFVDE